MPEGHTIHRAARDQRPMLAGKVLDVSSPQGRFLEGAARLDGRRCTAIDAYGKHLLYRFDDLSLHIHLGLFGRFRAVKRPAAEPKGAVLEGSSDRTSAFNLRTITVERSLSCSSLRCEAPSKFQP